MPPNCIVLGAYSLAAGNGGISRVARLTARVLADEARVGHAQCTAVVFNDLGPTEDAELPARTARGSRARFVGRLLCASVRHTHFAYDSEAMARAHALLPHRPFMTWMHGIEVWEGAARKRLRTARRADLLLANSAYTRDRATRVHGGFEHARVCWLGTEQDEPPRAAPRTSGPPTVVVIGRMELRRDKGHQALLDCWPTVVGRVRDARLVVVGRGPGLQSLEARARASGSGSSICFKGFVPEAQLEDVWATASVFAMPSLGEGFGLVYIEAMRHAVPVVASMHDAAPEVNLEGETGYNVDLAKPGQLADRLVHLLRNRDHAAALGRAGQSRWREHFRYGAFRERFLPHLRQLLAM